MYVPTDAFGGLNPEQVAANVLKKTCTLASMEVIRIREEEAEDDEAEEPSFPLLNKFMEENPYRPADAWTDKLTSTSEEGPMKTAANTLLSTREEYLTEGAITWDSVKSKTVESLQEEDAELMREYMMNSMTLSADDEELESRAEQTEESSVGKKEAEDNQ